MSLFRGVVGVTVDHTTIFSLVCHFVMHARWREPLARDNPVDVALFPAVVLLQRVFGALLEDTKCTIVAIGAKGKVVVAFADVDERSHLKVDGHFG